MDGGLRRASRVRRVRLASPADAGGGVLENSGLLTRDSWELAVGSGDELGFGTPVFCILSTVYRPPSTVSPFLCSVRWRKKLRCAIESTSFPSPLEGEGTTVLGCGEGAGILIDKMRSSSLSSSELIRGSKYNHSFFSAADKILEVDIFCSMAVKSCGLIC